MSEGRTHERDAAMRAALATPYIRAEGEICGWCARRAVAMVIDTHDGEPTPACEIHESERGTG